MSSETEQVKAGLILSELPGHQSRENVTIVSGQNLKFGTVVGKITASGKYSAYDDDNGDGTEAAAGVLVGEDIDATDGDKTGVILVKDAELNPDLLVWATGNDAGDIAAGKTDLAALGIKLRT